MHIFASEALIVGILNRSMDGLEGELTDSHTRIQRYRYFVDIGDLKSDSPLESWIYKTCCRMDDDTESSERATPLATSHEIVRNLDLFHRYSENKLSWMEYEFPSVWNLYSLDGIRIDRLTRMDDLEPITLIYLEEIPEPKIHTRWTDLLKYIVFASCREFYISGFHSSTYRAIGEDHRGMVKDKILTILRRYHRVY